MSNSQELEDQRHVQLAEHYRKLFEQADRMLNFHKGLLLDAYRTMRGQSKGLQRQRRIINRLRTEIAEMKAGLAGAGVLTGADARRFEEIMERSSEVARSRRSSREEPSLKG